MIFSFPKPTYLDFLLLKVVITGVGAALIDKAGRKPLLLVNSKHKKHFIFKLSFAYEDSLHVWYSYCSFLVSFRYLDQDWLQDVYLQQLHSISRYIPTKDPITSSFFNPDIYVKAISLCNRFMMWVWGQSQHLL